MRREVLKKAFVDEAEKTVEGHAKLSSVFILARILEIIDEVFDEEEKVPTFKTKTECLEWVLKNCDYMRGEEE